MHISDQPKSKDHHQSAVISPFNDEQVEESLTPSCSCTQMCFFWLSTSLLFERKVEDKTVWSDMPGISVGLALSSLLWSLKQTQPIKQHVNVHPTVGKRCTHKYRARREQWKMLTVKEAVTQKNTSPTHARVKFFLIHFLVMSDAGVYYQYEESWCVLTNTQIHPTGVIFNILCQAVQRNHFLYQHHNTGSSPELDQGIADMSGARYWRQEWLQEIKHLLQQTQRSLQTMTAQSKTTWDRVQNSESLVAGNSLVSWHEGHADTTFVNR